MSITQPVTGRSPSHSLHCPSCDAPLPANAAFCSSCGQRISKNTDWESGRSDVQNDSDMNTRYRITSLVRRRPYVNLFFAIDNFHPQQQRMVAIRDIDISSLNVQSRKRAMEVVQHEYDLLRYWQIPSVMPVIDLRSLQDHIFVVTAWKSEDMIHQAGAMNWAPTGETDAESQAGASQGVSTRATTPLGQGGETQFRQSEYGGGAAGQAQGTAPTFRERLYTLQDLLQSGLGLPDEQRALAWMRELSQALDILHSHSIILGDLDPYTIIFNSNSYEGQPALIVSWLLQDIRDLFLPISAVTNTSYFSAPEALLGNPEPRSDVYSLGAILYLLLTGTVPDAESVAGASGRSRGGAAKEGGARRRLRSPREMNGRISGHIDECIMRALSVDPSKRFPSAGAFAEALFHPVSSSRTKTAQGRAGSLEDLHQDSPLQMDKNATGTTQESVQQKPSLEGEQELSEEQDADTVRIVPLSETHVSRWRASRPLTNVVIPRRPPTSPLTSQEEQEQEPSPSSPERDSSILSDDEQDREESSSSPEHGSPEPLHSPFASDSEVQSAAPDEQAGRLEDIHQTPLDYDQPLQVVESNLISSEEVQEFSLSTPFYSSESVGAINRAPMLDEASEVSSPVSPGTQDEETQQRGSFFQHLKQLFWSWIGLLRSPEAAGTAGARAPAGLHSSAETARKEDQTRIPVGGVPTVQIPADPFASAKDANASFLKQIQRTLLGEQRHRISAAAIIETPLRVQLNQSYTIRIHIMGRDEVEVPGGEVESDQSGMHDKSAPYERGGLGSLVHGETVLIEVRSALPGRDTSGPYAYMAQQATVTMPARGYAAEVIMPLRPLSVGPSGRRERLHIFFLDEMRRPLYEKPFVVEVLVSHLVQPGREGHSVLTIPL